MTTSTAVLQDVDPRIMFSTSPYRGEVDFAPVSRAAGRPLDPVSIADLLRNAFVYPPHSIYRDVNGSGAILADDFSEVKKRFFTRLPAGSPPATSRTGTPSGARRSTTASRRSASCSSRTPATG